MNLSIPADKSLAISYNLKQMSDEILVAAAKAGDPAAFVELSNRHSGKLRRTLYRITRNWDDAEDALQDTLLKAFTKLNMFECRSSFSSWLTRIAINSALMVLRKKCASKEISIDCPVEDADIRNRWEMRDLTEDPERHFAKREREEFLKEAIRSLRPDFRVVVELQHTMGYSVKELAHTLGISLAAAKSRLMRARITLRTSLRTLLDA
jgi:RNA polymerase sigma-70 factor (ECF subfamily)